MNKQKYNIYVADGVNASIIIEAKAKLLASFEAVAKCPSKYCFEKFSLYNEDASIVKRQMAEKIRIHWMRVHEKVSKNRWLK